ncbi:MAG: GNAT family N-acetyltransferase [Hydrogenophaga sp.]|nr:GNAT family N-acetyltransferase [Hydrogenophaga sp.]
MIKQLLTNISALSLIFFSFHSYSTRATLKNPRDGYQPEVTSQTNACVTKIKIQLKKEGCIGGEIHLLYDDQAHTGRIQYLRVANHLRGSGLGKTLMRKALRTFDKLYCEKITLKACPLDTNDATETDDLQLKQLIAFYTQFGFKIIDPQNDPDDQYSSHMVKIIANSQSQIIPNVETS